ncbi:MAG: rod shape-determining protein MreC [Candidatus Chlorobium antarcticum]|nr:rod shape-determining protein MreC [Candidatus Chlorobium antarcticum]
MKKFFGFFFRNNSLLLLAVLSAISLIFMKMEEADVIRRISTTGTGFRSAIADKIASYGYLINLKSENDRLLETNLSLVAKILSAEDSLRNEADRLRIISSKAEGLKPFIIARVVDRQFSNRENMLLIDGGRSRGIGTDMTVMTPRGLVGRVVAVSEHYAKVMPLIHADFKASVVSSESGTMGVLAWNGGREDMATVDHVPISSSLKPGEKMLTTNFSTFAVPGLPVGQVVSVTQGTLFSTVIIRLAVDFSSLNHVVVVPLNRDPEKIRLLEGKTESETDR